METEEKVGYKGHEIKLWRDNDLENPLECECLEEIEESCGGFYSYEEALNCAKEVIDTWNAERN